MSPSATSPLSEKMSPTELRATAGLASIYGLRMLGMFIILPVFGFYAEQLPGGSNYTLVGIALGAYGLTQAILQIPFGWLSDRYRAQTRHLRRLDSVCHRQFYRGLRH